MVQGFITVGTHPNGSSRPRTGERYQRPTCAACEVGRWSFLAPRLAWLIDN
jgi:hypothetical protein